jgi:NADH-quinone oxidoreductase subunit L
MVVDILTCLIPLGPLVACLVTLLWGARVLREHSHWPAILGCGLSSICSLILLFCVSSLPRFESTITIYQWMTIEGEQPRSGGAATQSARTEGPESAATPAVSSLVPPIDITIALRVDSLSATMLAMLTFVATLVAIYSAGYMHGERGYWRFFTEVSLFVFSMIMLVLSANFLQLYMFWEAVGLCSYLLIGFWYEKPTAAAAAKKAFLVNRIGDFGFATGVFLIWTTFRTLNIENVLNPEAIAGVSAANPAMITLICVCLFMGAVGKSAQFPLHVWLPDAMEGPTPVSALIHAATMVTAGVYLVARCTPLFLWAPQAQMMVAFIGGFTALLAALIALTQTDLKRVLAYSTVSQLGYMFLGLGTGLLTGVSGAMFHLVTHAFFKALLFLGAGSVMHAMGGVIDMREFGGLKKIMPQTYRTFLIGALALAGLPVFSGFWSKDTILSAAYEASQASHPARGVTSTDSNRIGPRRWAPGNHTSSIDIPNVTPLIYEIDELGNPLSNPEPRLLGLSRTALFKLLFWIGTCTALLTAFYTFRAVFMTFWGPEKIPHEAGHHAHESPRVMCVPLWILAVGALGLGALLDQHTTGIINRFLGLTIRGLQAEVEHHEVNWFVMGLSTVVALAGSGLAWVMYGAPSSLPARVSAIFGPLADLSRNKFYLDEIYESLVVWPLRGLATLSRFLDWGFIDGLLVSGIGKLPALAGRLPRPIQNGLVQFYALAMSLGLAVLLWVLLTRG